MLIITQGYGGGTVVSQGYGRLTEPTQQVIPVDLDGDADPDVQLRGMNRAADMVNPQDIEISAFESREIVVTMAAVGDISSATYELNVRDFAEGVVLQSTAYTITDPGGTGARGVVEFPLTSTQTGSILGAGAWLYDVWRTDSGNEKRLAYGSLTVLDQQWKP